MRSLKKLAKKITAWLAPKHTSPTVESDFTAGQTIQTKKTLSQSVLKVMGQTEGKDYLPGQSSISLKNQTNLFRRPLSSTTIKAPEDKPSL